MEEERRRGGRKKGSFMALFRDVLSPTPTLALVHVKLERGGHQNSWLVVHWRERNEYLVPFFVRLLCIQV